MAHGWNTDSAPVAWYILLDSLGSQIASKRYSNIIVTLAQTLDKRLPLTLVER